LPFHPWLTVAWHYDPCCWHSSTTFVAKPGYLLDAYDMTPSTQLANVAINLPAGSIVVWCKSRMKFPMTVDWKRWSPCAESVSCVTRLFEAYQIKMILFDIRWAAPSRIARPIWQKNGGGHNANKVR